MSATRCVVSSLALVLFLAACGEPEPVGVTARVVAVAFETAAVQGGTLLDRDPGAAGELAAGQRLALGRVATRRGRHTVELRYEGAEPALSVDGLSPLRVASASTRDVVVFRVDELTPADALTVVVSAPTRLRRVLVRSLAADEATSSGREALGEALRTGRPVPITLNGDRRPGWVIRPDGVLELAVEVPPGATALRVTTGPAPLHGGRSRAGLLAGPGLVVTLQCDGRDPERWWLEGNPTSGLSGPGAARWCDHRVELRDVSPGPATMRLHARGPDTATGGGWPAGGLVQVSNLAVSVPEFLCESERRPTSLVMISLDTVRRDHLGLYGYGRDTTPRLDAFAREAVVFDDALSTAPWTLPSHATMFTGQYPTVHGAVHPELALDSRASPYLPFLLHRAGWATRAYTGGGYLSADYGFAHGFAGYGHHDPLRDWDNPRYGRYLLTRPGQEELAVASAQDWDTALGWLRAHRDLPFFLLLHTFVVHDYRAPLEWQVDWHGSEPVVDELRSLAVQRERPYSQQDTAELVDRYDAALAWADAHVGQVLDTLASLGRNGDTVVVVTADHGEAFGERGWVGHGRSLAAEMTRVPLLIRVPGMAPRRVAARTSLVDLAPTLLELLGQPVPAAMQGRSLVPLMRAGADPPRPSPAWAEVSSNIAARRALSVGDHKLIVGNPAALVELPLTEPVRLFDTAADPAETMDLHGDDPERTADLLRRLEAFGAELEALRRGRVSLAGVGETTQRQLEELGYVDR